MTISSVTNQQPQHSHAEKSSIDKKLSSDNNNNNVEYSHPLSIISIPHVHIPHIKIPFHLPFH